MADLTKQIQLILSAKDNASLALKGVEDRFSGLQNAGRQLLSVLGPLAGAFAFREIVQTATAFEGYNNALKAVTGSQQAANAEIAFVRELSEQLGTDLEASIDAYTKLSAAAKGTGLDLDDTRRIFGAVSTAATVLGLSTDDTKGALTALSQMLSKGKVSAEELRGQLGERLPGAFNLFAKSMGVSTAELDKMLQNGEVIASETLPKFADALLNAYGPGVEDAANSTRAALNRFNNDLTDLKLQFADAGVLDAFTSALGLVSDVVSHPDFKAALTDLGGGFKDLINQAGGAEEFASGLVKVFETLALGLQTALVPLKVMGEGIGAVAAAISLAVTGDLAGAAKALEEFNPLEQLEEGFLNLEPTVQRFLGDSAEAADATQEQGKAAAEAATKINELTEEEKAAAEATGGAAKASKDDAEAKKAQSKETEAAAERAAKLTLEMEKLASNERIKNIELAVGFKTAKLEADTKRIEAAFASVDKSIESTGDLLGGLFDNLSDAGGFGDRWAIQDQIDQENERREKAFELQNRLTEQQIEQARLRNNLLKRDGAFIKIDSTGLEPALEMVMWEVLKKVQIRATEDAQEFLLGV